MCFLKVIDLQVFFILSSNKQWDQSNELLAFQGKYLLLTVEVLIFVIEDIKSRKWIFQGNLNTKFFSFMRNWRISIIVRQYFVQWLNTNQNLAFDSVSFHLQPKWNHALISKRFWMWKRYHNQAAIVLQQVYIACLLIAIIILFIEQGGRNSRYCEMISTSSFVDLLITDSSLNYNYPYYGA